jgi:hypothetical protein
MGRGLGAMEDDGIDLEHESYIALAHFLSRYSNS